MTGCASNSSHTDDEIPVFEFEKIGRTAFYNAPSLQDSVRERALKK